MRGASRGYPEEPQKTAAYRGLFSGWGPGMAIGALAWLSTWAGSSASMPKWLFNYNGYTGG